MSKSKGSQSKAQSPKAQSPKKGKRHGKNEDEKDSLAFKFLSAENTKKLAEVEDVDDLQEKLAEVLEISKHHIDLKEGAQLDYFVAGFWWAKEQGYSHEQISAFYSVIHILLDNIKEKQMSVVDNLKEFRKMLGGIGQEPNPEATTPKPPSGGLEGLYDVNQAKSMIDYVYTSVFQHYQLYEFLYSHTQAEEIIGTDLELELPLPASMPWPPPLDEGIPEDIYREHIATPPPTPQPEEGAEGAEAEGATGDGSGEEAADDAEVSAHEADVLAQLTTEEVQQIMDSVFDEMLGGVKTEVATKLREKENVFINRINKIHKVAE